MEVARVRPFTLNILTSWTKLQDRESLLAITPTAATPIIQPIATGIATLKKAAIIPV